MDIQRQFHQYYKNAVFVSVHLKEQDNGTPHERASGVQAEITDQVTFVMKRESSYMVI